MARQPPMFQHLVRQCYFMQPQMARQPPMFQHFVAIWSCRAFPCNRKWLGSHRCFSILATSRSLSAPSWSRKWCSWLLPGWFLAVPGCPWLLPGCSLLLPGCSWPASWLRLACFLAPWLLLAAPGPSSLLPGCSLGPSLLFLACCSWRC